MVLCPTLSHEGPALTEEDYDEIDRFHRARDDGNISLDPSRDEEDEDDGGDVGVFQLDVDSDSDTSSEGDDDDDEEGDEDEEVPQATRKPVKGGCVLTVCQEHDLSD